jgi:hypothetical protein
MGGWLFGGHDWETRLCQTASRHRKFAAWHRAPAAAQRDLAGERNEVSFYHIEKFK